MKRTFALLGAAAVVGSALVAGCGDDSGEGGGTTATTGTNAGPASGTPASNATTATSSGNNTGTTSTANQSSASTTAAGGNFDCSPSDGSMPTLDLQTVDNFEQPLLVTFAPGDTQHIYVVEKTGRIVVHDGMNEVGTFLDLTNEITTVSEQGVLGLAFHPDYANNGRVFVHYSEEMTEDSMIVEFARSAGDPLVADPAPVQVVLRHPTAQDNHNGGATAFGPDGFLYINLGDGGTQDDPQCDAQILDSADGGDNAIDGPNYLGKIVRVDVNQAAGADGYPAAAGNPDGHKAYHLGFRNPWRSSFDGCTGNLFIGDVGQDTREEVSMVAPADGPQNFGWPYREGTSDHGANNCPPEPANLREPILDYPQAGTGGCSVTGGYVYRSAEIPGLRGTYFFGDLCIGEVWAATEDDQGVWTRTDTGLSTSSLSSFGQDALGNVYVVSLDGPVYKIVAQ